MSPQGIRQALTRVSSPELPTLSGPQKLGFLPTMGFWSRRDIKKPLLFFVAPFAFAAGLGVAFVSDYFPAGWAWSSLLGAMAGGSMLLYLGALEKVIRREIKNRAQLATKAPDLIGPSGT